MLNWAFELFNEDNLIKFAYIFIVGPVLVYLGVIQTRTPVEVYTTSLILGIIIIVYNAHKIYEKLLK